MPIGSLIKTIAVYDRPFWREQGLNGQANSDQGPVKVTFDASPASGTPGVMLGFIDGDDARALSDAPASRRAECGARILRPLLRRAGGAPEDLLRPGVGA